MHVCMYVYMAAAGEKRLNTNLIKFFVTCMYACTYVHMHTYINTWKEIKFVVTYMHTSISAWIYIKIHTCILARTHTALTPRF